jgi:hypothetical protein
MKTYLAITCSILLLNLGCGTKSSTKKHEAPPAESNDDGGGKGDDADGKGENPPSQSSDSTPRNAPAGTPTCEELWQKIVGQTSAGEYSVYETTAKSNYSGTEIVAVSSIRQEVAAVSADAIIWKYHTEVNGAAYDSNSDLNKADFVKSCGSNGPDGSPENKPVEEGDEMITVKAGTFQTHWAKFVMEKDGIKATVKSWSHTAANGDTFVVKSESHTEGDTGTSSSVTELVERNG